MSRVIMYSIMAFVGIMFILNIAPEIETAIAATTITNTFVLAILDMAEWLLPVAALMGIFYGMFRLFSSGRKGD